MGANCSSCSNAVAPAAVAINDAGAAEVSTARRSSKYIHLACRHYEHADILQRAIDKLTAITDTGDQSLVTVQRALAGHLRRHPVCVGGFTALLWLCRHSAAFNSACHTSGLTEQILESHSSLTTLLFPPCTDFQPQPLPLLPELPTTAPVTGRELLYFPTTPSDSGKEPLSGRTQRSLVVPLPAAISVNEIASPAARQRSASAQPAHSNAGRFSPQRSAMASVRSVSFHRLDKKEPNEEKEHSSPLAVSPSNDDTASHDDFSFHKLATRQASKSKLRRTHKPYNAGEEKEATDGSTVTDASGVALNDSEDSSKLTARFHPASLHSTPAQRHERLLQSTGVVIPKLRLSLAMAETSSPQMPAPLSSMRHTRRVKRKSEFFRSTPLSNDSEHVASSNFAQHTNCEVPPFTHSSRVSQFTHRFSILDIDSAGSVVPSTITAINYNNNDEYTKECLQKLRDLAVGAGESFVAAQLSSILWHKNQLSEADFALLGWTNLEPHSSRALAGHHSRKSRISIESSVSSSPMGAEISTEVQHSEVPGERADGAPRPSDAYLLQCSALLLQSIALIARSLTDDRRRCAFLHALSSHFASFNRSLRSPSRATRRALLGKSLILRLSAHQLNFHRWLLCSALQVVASGPVQRVSTQCSAWRVISPSFSLPLLGAATLKLSFGREFARSAAVCLLPPALISPANKRCTSESFEQPQRQPLWIGASATMEPSLLSSQLAAAQTGDEFYSLMDALLFSSVQSMARIQARTPVEDASVIFTETSHALRSLRAYTIHPTCQAGLGPRQVGLSGLGSGEYGGSNDCCVCATTVSLLIAVCGPVLIDLHGQLARTYRVCKDQASEAVTLSSRANDSHCQLVEAERLACFVALMQLWTDVLSHRSSAAVDRLLIKILRDATCLQDDPNSEQLKFAQTTGGSTTAQDTHASPHAADFARNRTARASRLTKRTSMIGIVNKQVALFSLLDFVHSHAILVFATTATAYCLFRSAPTQSKPAADATHRSRRMSMATTVLNSIHSSKLSHLSKDSPIHSSHHQQQQQQSHSQYSEEEENLPPPSSTHTVVNQARLVIASFYRAATWLVQRAQFPSLSGTVTSSPIILDMHAASSAPSARRGFTDRGSSRTTSDTAIEEEDSDDDGEVTVAGTQRNHNNNNDDYDSGEETQRQRRVRRLALGQSSASVSEPSLAGDVTPNPASWFWISLNDMIAPPHGLLYHYTRCVSNQEAEILGGNDGNASDSDDSESDDEAYHRPVNMSISHSSEAFATHRHHNATHSHTRRSEQLVVQAYCLLVRDAFAVTSPSLCPLLFTNGPMDRLIRFHFVSFVRLYHSLTPDDTNQAQMCALHIQVLTAVAAAPALIHRHQRDERKQQHGLPQRRASINSKGNALPAGDHITATMLRLRLVHFLAKEISGEHDAFVARTWSQMPNASNQLSVSVGTARSLASFSPNVAAARSREAMALPPLGLSTVTATFELALDAPLIPSPHYNVSKVMNSSLTLKSAASLSETFVDRHRRTASSPHVDSFMLMAPITSMTGIGVSTDSLSHRRSIEASPRTPLPPHQEESESEEDDDDSDSAVDTMPNNHDNDEMEGVMEEESALKRRHADEDETLVSEPASAACSVRPSTTRSSPSAAMVTLQTSPSNRFNDTKSSVRIEDNDGEASTLRNVEDSRSSGGDDNSGDDEDLEYDASDLSSCPPSARPAFRITLPITGAVDSSGNEEIADDNGTDEVSKNSQSDHDDDFEYEASELSSVKASVNLSDKPMKTGFALKLNLSGDSSIAMTPQDASIDDGDVGDSSRSDTDEAMMNGWSASPTTTPKAKLGIAFDLVLPPTNTPFDGEQPDETIAEDGDGDGDREKASVIAEACDEHSPLPSEHVAEQLKLTAVPSLLIVDTDSAITTPVVEHQRLALHPSSRATATESSHRVVAVIGPDVSMPTLPSPFKLRFSTTAPAESSLPGLVPDPSPHEQLPSPLHSHSGSRQVRLVDPPPSVTSKSHAFARTRAQSLGVALHARQQSDDWLSPHVGHTRFQSKSILNKPNMALEYYAKQRQSRRLYDHHSLHVAIIRLLLACLVDSEGLSLSAVYCDRSLTSAHSKINSDTDILSLLSSHLNQPHNALVLDTVCAIEMQSHISPISRLLKLLNGTLFQPSVYQSQASTQIGRGQFAQVYLSKASHCDEPLAIKQIDGSCAAHQRVVLFDLFAEVSVMTRLRDSVGVVPLYDYGVSKGQYYLVMKASQCSLKSWRDDIARHRPAVSMAMAAYSVTGHASTGVRAVKDIQSPCFSESQLALYIVIFRRVLVCMRSLTRTGVAHFDLKCDNVLIDAQSDDIHDWRVQLADFGESVISDSGKAQSRISRGTENIQSPEMLMLTQSLDSQHHTFDRRRRNAAPDQASDVWGIGCLFFELLTNRFLFEASDGIPIVMRVNNIHQPLLNESHRALIGTLGGKPNRPIIKFLSSVLVHDKERRPSMAKVESLFELMVSQLFPQGLQPHGWHRQHTLSPLPALSVSRSTVFGFNSKVGDHRAHAKSMQLDLTPMRTLSKFASTAAVESTIVVKELTTDSLSPTIDPSPSPSSAGEMQLALPAAGTARSKHRSSQLFLAERRAKAVSSLIDAPILPEWILPLHAIARAVSVGARHGAATAMDHHDYFDQTGQHHTHFLHLIPVIPSSTIDDSEDDTFVLHAAASGSAANQLLGPHARLDKCVQWMRNALALNGRILVFADTDNDGGLSDVEQDALRGLVCAFVMAVYGLELIEAAAMVAEKLRAAPVHASGMSATMAQSTMLDDTHSPRRSSLFNKPSLMRTNSTVRSSTISTNFTQSIKPASETSQSWISKLAPTLMAWASQSTQVVPTDTLSVLTRTLAGVNASEYRTYRCLCGACSVTCSSLASVRRCECQAHTSEDSSPCPAQPLGCAWHRSRLQNLFHVPFGDSASSSLLAWGELATQHSSRPHLSSSSHPLIAQAQMKDLQRFDAVTNSSDDSAWQLYECRHCLYPLIAILHPAPSRAATAATAASVPALTTTTAGTSLTLECHSATGVVLANDRSTRGIAILTNLVHSHDCTSALTALTPSVGCSEAADSGLLASFDRRPTAFRSSVA